MNIAWIGLGKLGLPCASVVASKFSVVGYDIRDDIVADFPIAESIGDAINGADWIFVSVPTPHDQRYGGAYPTSELPPRDFDYSILKSTLTDIAQFKTDAQQVVVISTVLPQTIRRDLAPIISDLIYNPYLIALGTVAEDFINPEIVIIGSNNNSRVGELVELYKAVQNTTSYELLTWEEAEITKVGYNTFTTLKINFVNTLHDICHKVGYSNIDNITNAIAKCREKIISGRYMTAGMGISGPCHPRDIIAMRWLAEELKLGYNIFNEMAHAREIQAKNLASLLCSYNLPVVMVGLGYKENLSLQDGSYSLLVMHYVSKQTNQFYVHDPMNDVHHTADQRSVYFISQHHDYVGDMKFYDGSIIIDPWRKELDVPNCKVVNY